MTLVWPDTLIEIVVICVLALFGRGLLKRLLRRSVAKAAAHAEERTAGLTGRATAALAQAGGLNMERQAHRTRTIGTMLGSLVDAILLVVVVFMVLQALGVNIMPAMASAGIGGLAIGFGAQSLVRDVIAGIFLMLEDQFGVGDHIDIGTHDGNVLSLGLRATRIQDGAGEIWYIRNGEIATLGNRTQGWSTGTITIPVALGEDPQNVISVLNKVCQELEEEPQWAEQTMEPPTVLGLTAFEASRAIYTITVKCPTNKQWAVERELRSRVMTAFQSANIQIPA